MDFEELIETLSKGSAVTLDADARIAIGDKVIFRGRDEYWLQTVESLQRQREPVQQASGPGAVGIASSLPDDFARPGGEVYVMVCDEAAASL
jgi:hypothetical protein